ncbi:Short-chain dehydrogenase/reductase SDR [Mycena sanguinolenta]|uniref:Short-chain dehydrogenase/reductase SDR n=1 Tax=Mycena sanguinolenta TaxID=230812 RepID=A0A8H6XUA0_9AGAR|nr:Short-chain dehydrogenase/reductase SDR [Mycena sanguinolenta]
MGLATVKALLAANCSVMGADISQAPDIQHASFAFEQMDLTHTDSPRVLVQACQKKFGEKIDILLNVAGIMDTFTSVATVTDAEFERVIAVNLTAPVRLMREVVQVMKANKHGVIVNVSSKAGTSGAAAGFPYTVSKHGLIGATKNTAYLLKGDGIRCNAICPGGVATNIMAGIDPSKYDSESYATLKPSFAVQGQLNGENLISAESIANALLFLASDLGKDINGAVLPIDNGWSVI